MDPACLRRERPFHIKPPDRVAPRFACCLIFRIDSFQGFDKTVPHYFKDTSSAVVEGNAAVFGLSNVTIVPGYFRDSFKTADSRRFSLFLSTATFTNRTWSVFRPSTNLRLVSGGGILFDEYYDPGWPGAKRAVDEF